MLSASGESVWPLGIHTASSAPGPREAKWQVCGRTWPPASPLFCSLLLSSLACQFWAETGAFDTSWLGAGSVLQAFLYFSKLPGRTLTPCGLGFLESGARIPPPGLQAQPKWDFTASQPASLGSQGSTYVAGCCTGLSQIVFMQQHIQALRCIRSTTSCSSSPREHPAPTNESIRNLAGDLWVTDHEN